MRLYFHEIISIFISFLSFQPSFLQFRLDRFETSLNLPKEDQIKLKENKVLTDSLENKENSQPNQFSERSEDHEQSTSKDEVINTNHEAKNVPKKSSGPRALKRRHGRKYNKSTLQRRSSFNGHW